ncbi:hypothetical protein [Telluribacter sp.]|uniref:hypothetical protein n=1 Tax=Telluribacter sp. TaxID=1978767 RepID=UPI002E138AC7
MSLLTKDAGLLVGNGPTVSEGTTAQVLELVPGFVTEPVVPSVGTIFDSALVQLIRTTGVVTAPTNKLFKNPFLSMGIYCFNIKQSCP